MHFQEIDTGDFRIYAGAIERNGLRCFQAAVVVVRLRACGRGEEVFRDDAVGGSFLWGCPKEALRFALQRGRDVVMSGGLIAQRA